MSDHDTTTAEVPVGELSEFEPGTVRRVEAEGRSIAIARVGDDLYAIGDTCTHEDVSLSEGELDEDDCTVECDKHGSLFSLQTGDALTLPATKPVPTYDVEARDGTVWVVIR